MSWSRVGFIPELSKVPSQCRRALMRYLSMRVWARSFPVLALMVAAYRVAMAFYDHRFGSLPGWVLMSLPLCVVLAWRRWVVRPALRSAVRRWLAARADTLTQRAE
ncbi:hypothetical protein [Oleiagrimonas sp. C23AA]|uniref:hypothetical protein n=1 Tax=Oleiagrimonas sp. C23AA TaxID=2719047 RepID=UPI001420764B|nr:hypothetical protein [Oleiagrimonas sp. C23AA]NII11529.1 hypothetical protein [Oleiagrimonas sp. C23AA]